MSHERHFIESPYSSPGQTMAREDYSKVKALKMFKKEFLISI